MSKSTKIIAALGVVAGLGVAALPMASFAADPISTSANAQISVEIEPAIAIAIKGDADEGTYGSSNVNPASLEGTLGVASILAGPSSSSTKMTQNAKDETMNSVVTVYTNNNSGWELSVKDADAETALVSTTNASDKIPAGNSIAAGTAAWGYKAEGTKIVTGADSYAAITASDVKIAEDGAKTIDGIATTVYYGVATATDQATGTYQDVITYTATVK